MQLREKKRKNGRKSLRHRSIDFDPGSTQDKPKLGRFSWRSKKAALASSDNLRSKIPGSFLSSPVDTRNRERSPGDKNVPRTRNPRASAYAHSSPTPELAPLCSHKVLDEPITSADGGASPMRPIHDFPFASLSLPRSLFHRSILASTFLSYVSTLALSFCLPLSPFVSDANSFRPPFFSHTLTLSFFPHFLPPNDLSRSLYLIYVCCMPFLFGFTLSPSYVLTHSPLMLSLSLSLPVRPGHCWTQWTVLAWR